jgi:hypothetical protein
MNDEEQHIAWCIAALNSNSPLLAAELLVLLARRRRVNNLHRTRISKIYSLKTYTGPQDPGIHAIQGHPVAASESLDESPDDFIFTADEDDLVGDQLDGLTTYLESLSLDSVQD